MVFNVTFNLNIETLILAFSLMTLMH